MTPRGRRVALALGFLAALLFAGRWATAFLAEQWWAAEATGAGAVFLTRWTLLRIGLDLGATILAVGWFALNLLRAAQLAGRVAPDELSTVRQRAPLRPELLRWWGAGVALVLGVLTGAGTAEWATPLSLALADPRWGLVDPLQGMDAGFYIAQFPLWTRIQQLALALTLLGFIATVLLYAVGGALRVAARQFVLDPGIRLHLGLLGAALAVALAAGFYLEPYALAAGLRPATGTAHAVLLVSLSRVLLGFAVATALLTALWGIRGRAMLPVGAWATLALFALVVRLLAPAAGGPVTGDRSHQELREREQEAFNLAVADASAPEGHPAPATAALLLWDERTVAADTGDWLAADRVGLDQGGVRRPTTLLVGLLSGRPGLGVTALASDQVSATGGPLAWRGDTIPYPGTAPLMDLPGASSWPGARGVQVGNAGAAGVRAGGLVRRVALTWALQTNILVASPDDHVAWRRDPGERLRAVAPFVEWGAPRPRVVGDRLVWLSDGYLYAGSFPGVAPIPWRGRSVSYLRAAYVGVVDAVTGKVRVVERGAPDPLTTAWSGRARGMVEPDTTLEAGLAAELPYPAELFAVQSLLLQRPHWGLGSLAAPPSALAPDTLGGPAPVAAYVGTDRARLAALVEGVRRDAQDQVRLHRLDSLGTLDPPAILVPRWDRLPFVQQTRDSVLATGARYVPGPLHLLPVAGGALAWQYAHAVDATGRGTLVLVNLALGGRLGTGSRVERAWQNLRGELAAFPRSMGAEAQLREAREWLARADSAFRRGDLAAFGRAFEALRNLLDNPPATPR